MGYGIGFIEGFVGLKSLGICSKKEFKKVLDKWEKGLPLPNFRSKKPGVDRKDQKDKQVH